MRMISLSKGGGGVFRSNYMWSIKLREEKKQESFSDPSAGIV